MEDGRNDDGLEREIAAWLSFYPPSFHGLLTITAKHFYTMATKLHGRLILNRIPQELIDYDQSGNAVIWIDVIEKRESPDKYGNTHSVTMYNKEAEQGQRTVYLGDLKPQEFGASADAQGVLGAIYGKAAPAAPAAPAGVSIPPIQPLGQPRGVLARSAQRAAGNVPVGTAPADPGLYDPAQHEEDLPAAFYEK